MNIKKKSSWKEIQLLVISSVKGVIWHALFALVQLQMGHTDTHSHTDKETGTEKQNKKWQ